MFDFIFPGKNWRNKGWRSGKENVKKSLNSIGKQIDRYMDGWIHRQIDGETEKGGVGMET